MKHVLASVVVLSALFASSPARAELYSENVVITAGRYVPGNCDQVANDPHGVPTCTQPTFPDQPVNNNHPTWLTVTPSGSLNVRNFDASEHSITADVRTVDGDPLFTSVTHDGESTKIPPADAGRLELNGTLVVNRSYTFHCIVHSTMHGVLHVVP
jgi:hypothetical protein